MAIAPPPTGYLFRSPTGGGMRKIAQLGMDDGIYDGYDLLDECYSVGKVSKTTMGFHPQVQRLVSTVARESARLITVAPLASIGITGGSTAAAAASTTTAGGGAPSSSSTAASAATTAPIDVNARPHHRPHKALIGWYCRDGMLCHIETLLRAGKITVGDLTGVSTAATTSGGFSGLSGAADPNNASASAVEAVIDVVERPPVPTFAAIPNLAVSCEYNDLVTLLGLTYDGDDADDEQHRYTNTAEGCGGAAPSSSSYRYPTKRGGSSGGKGLHNSAGGGYGEIELEVPQGMLGGPTTNSTAAPSASSFTTSVIDGLNGAILRAQPSPALVDATYRKTSEFAATTFLSKHHPSAHTAAEAYKATCVNATVIMWAALGGHAGIIRFVLEAATSVATGGNSFSPTPILTTNHSNRVSILSHLLNTPFEGPTSVLVPKMFLKGQTALHWSVMEGRFEVLQYLASLNMSMAVANGRGQQHVVTSALSPTTTITTTSSLPTTLTTPVDFFVKDMHHIDVIAMAIQHDRFDVLAYVHYTMLRLAAAAAGAGGGVGGGIGAGVSAAGGSSSSSSTTRLPITTDVDGHNALHWSAYRNNIAALEYCHVVMGIPLTSVDGQQRTALHWAAREGSYECVMYMLSQRQQQQQQQQENINNVSVAGDGCGEEKRGLNTSSYAINPHQKDCDGATALDHAMARRQPLVVIEALKAAMRASAGGSNSSVGVSKAESASRRSASPSSSSSTSLPSTTYTAGASSITYLHLRGTMAMLGGSGDSSSSASSTSSQAFRFLLLIPFGLVIGFFTAMQFVPPLIGLFLFGMYMGKNPVIHYLVPRPIRTTAEEVPLPMEVGLAESLFGTFRGTWATRRRDPFALGMCVALTLMEFLVFTLYGVPLPTLFFPLLAVVVGLAFLVKRKAFEPLIEGKSLLNLSSGAASYATSYYTNSSEGGVPASTRTVSASLALLTGSSNTTTTANTNTVPTSSSLSAPTYQNSNTSSDLLKAIVRDDVTFLTANNGGGRLLDTQRHVRLPLRAGYCVELDCYFKGYDGWSVLLDCPISTHVNAHWLFYFAVVLAVLQLLIANSGFDYLLNEYCAALYPSPSSTTGSSAASASAAEGSYSTIVGSSSSSSSHLSPFPIIGNNYPSLTFLVSIVTGGMPCRDSPVDATTLYGTYRPSSMNAAAPWLWFYPMCFAVGVLVGVVYPLVMSAVYAVTRYEQFYPFVPTSAVYGGAGITGTNDATVDGTAAVDVGAAMMKAPLAAAAGSQGQLLPPSLEPTQVMSIYRNVGGGGAARTHQTPSSFPSSSSSSYADLINTSLPLRTARAMSRNEVGGDGTILRETIYGSGSKITNLWRFLGGKGVGSNRYSNGCAYTYDA